MGAFTDQLQKLNTEQEQYISFKLAKEQERAKEKAQNLKYKNAKTNIEILLIDFFNNIHNKNINYKDFKNLINDIKSNYINNNNFSEYQKDDLQLFTNKKISQLKKAKIAELNKQEKAAEAAQKILLKQQQIKRPIDWTFWIVFIIVFILCIIIDNI